jgi:hypothetical protein
MNDFKLKKNIRGVVLAASLVFIAVGIIRREHLVVLKKAVNICLECIGIG